MTHLYRDALKRVFFSGKYISIAMVSFGILFVFFLLLSQIFVIRQFFLTNASFTDKVSVAIDSMYTAFIYLGVGNSIYLIVFALLGAIQITLFTYLLKEKIQREGMYTRGIGGMILGFIGIGCGACGSVILTSALSLFLGTGGALAFTSQWGSGIGLIGMALLLYAIISTIKSIANPLVCK